MPSVYKHKQRNRKKNKGKRKRKEKQYKPQKSPNKYKNRKNINKCKSSSKKQQSVQKLQSVQNPHYENKPNEKNTNYTMNDDNKTNSSNSPSTHVCASCHEDKSHKRCPCQCVYYCDTKCQRDHWKIHKNECVTNCKSIETCPALRRMICLLKEYKTNNDMDEEEVISEFVMQCIPYFINDYHHILECHLNASQNEENKNFAFIYTNFMNDANNLFCDAKTCKIFKRNNRKKEEEKTKFNRDLSVYMDLLDTIHCYFIHSVDCGYRIVDKHNDDIIALKSYLHSKKQSLMDIAGKHRFMNNKFFSKEPSFTIPDKNGTIDTIQEVADDDKKVDESVNDDIYCFGQIYNYNHFSVKGIDDDEYKFCPKYASIKEEVTSSRIHTIPMDELQSAYKKATFFMKNSNKVKKMGSNFYPNYMRKTLNVENILAVLLYTDYSALSFHFSSTWRRMSTNESAREIAERHRDFWFWGKTLTETVHFFGTNGNDFNMRIVFKEKPITKFYHGVSKLYFDSFISSFNAPTSTTGQLTVATMFAQNDGIIIEVQSYHPNVMYFDCSFLSRFGNEDERLFIQDPTGWLFNGDSKLQIVNVSEMSSDLDYESVVTALKKFELLINNEEIDNLMGQSLQSIDIICELIKNILKTTNANTIVAVGLLQSMDENDDEYCHANDFDIRNLPSNVIQKLLLNHKRGIRGFDDELKHKHDSKKSWKAAIASDYGETLFKKWRNKQEILSFEMSFMDTIQYPQKFLNCFIFPKKKSLIMFDVMNLIFTNVQIIDCFGSGDVELDEINIIYLMLKKINAYKFSKLKLIQLRDITYPTYTAILPAIKYLNKTYFHPIKWRMGVYIDHDYDYEFDQISVPKMVFGKLFLTDEERNKIENALLHSNT